MYWAFIVNPTAGTGYALKAMDRLEELLGPAKYKKDEQRDRDEIDLVRGLAYTSVGGEVLDVDAYTGGFNLQIAFSTGHLAGESV